MLHLSVAQAQLGENYKAIDLLGQAQETLQILEQVNAKVKKSSKFETPPDILMQHILYTKAVMLNATGACKEAATVFTQALEFGKVYDPTIRRRCLEELRAIFESQKLYHRCVNLQRLLENYEINNKDLVILLDYSGSMAESYRIQHALKNILRVFDRYVKAEDRIGLITFDLNSRVVFNLTEKGANMFQLRQQIENCNK